MEVILSGSKTLIIFVTVMLIGIVNAMKNQG